ncbi:MAG: AraC family transcriptional regulator [Verrucomicrobiae bacterium]|nr:AraC family transcriptional regulator [Verrucomicrobiae bacterium]
MRAIGSSPARTIETLAGTRGVTPSSPFPFHIERISQARCGEHRHEFLELVYVWKGEASHVANDCRTPLKSGDVFFISRRDWHGYEDCRDLQIVNILFLPPALGSRGLEREEYRPFYDAIFLESVSKQSVFHLHLAGLLDVRVRALLEEMLQEHAAKGRGYQEILKNDLRNLLILLTRSRQRDDALSRELAGAVAAQQHRFQQALHFMEIHFAQKISLPQVAGLACVSPNYFSELFHKVIGKTFLQYLTDLRMKHAALLLTGTDLGVKDVAARSGFSDFRHFMRTFKKFHGATPGVFRKKAATI